MGSRPRRTDPVPRESLAPISSRDQDDTLVQCPACHQYAGTCLLCGGCGVVSPARYRDWVSPPDAA